MLANLFGVLTSQLRVDFQGLIAISASYLPRRFGAEARGDPLGSPLLFWGIAQCEPAYTWMDTTSSMRA